MKKSSLLAAFAFVLCTPSVSQTLENHRYAISGFGYHNEHPILFLGAAANVNRVYAAANMTIHGARNVPGILELRAGYIIGNAYSVVVYGGYAYEPRLNTGEWIEDAAKGEATRVIIPARSCFTYGIMLSAPTKWEKTAIMAGLQLYGFGNTGSPGILSIGIRHRLSYSSCD